MPSCGLNATARFVRRIYIMGNLFLFAVNAVLPLVLVIALGYLLKRSGMLNANFLKTGNKLIFRAALPTLLFYNVYGIGGLSEIEWNTVLYAVAMTLILFGLGLVTVTFAVKDRRRKGSVLQCVFRSNFAIIGIPLAGAIGSSGALAAAAVLSAFTIPLFNILAVIALSVYAGGDSGGMSIAGVLKGIAKNPLITGVAAGLVCLAVRRYIPVNADGTPVFSIKNNLSALYTAAGWIADIASPLALIVLGGQFEFSAVKGMKYEIILGTLWRIVLAPLIALGAAAAMTKCGIVSFTPAHFPAFIALFGSPVAVSSAIMASEMNSDGELASQLVVWTTIGSAFTVFAAVVILKAMALI